MNKFIKISFFSSIFIFSWSLYAEGAGPTKRPQDMIHYLQDVNNKKSKRSSKNKKLTSGREGLYEVILMPKITMISLSEDGNHVAIVGGILKEKGHYVNGMEIVEIKANQIILKSSIKQEILYFPARENSSIIKKELGKRYK